MKEQAKKQAILDIKKELARDHKCFLAFHTSLNPIMDKLVNEQLKAQKLWNANLK